MKSVINACVVGATGYAGVELCRLLLGHPSFHLAMATDRKRAGTPISKLYPAFRGLCDLKLSQPDPKAIAAAADVAFLAVPHTAAMSLAPTLLAAGVTVFDLSADYRLRDPSVFEHWYDAAHTSPELLASTTYSLPELFRDGLYTLAARRSAGEAVLASIPGCYPTATMLAAAPALKAGLVSADTVIVSAVSGVSGAGRTPSERTHFCHINESVEPYGVAHHRHTPEIEQGLTDLAGRDISVVFAAHLAPLTRGLLSTVFLELAENVSEEEVYATYVGAYENEALVTVLPLGMMPATGSVAGTARAQVGIAADLRKKPTLVAACAIDNLGKGAAAQAVQAANVVCGLSETSGLIAPAPVI